MNWIRENRNKISRGLLAFILLYLVTYAAAQNPVLNRRIMHRAVTVEHYDPDAELYFLQSTGPLSVEFKRAVSWGFEDLKETGNYNKIDILFWAPGPNQALARSNWVNPSLKLTEEITSGWVPDLWWQGDGTRYLNLNWNPVSDPGNYTQNNSGVTLLTMQGLLYEPKSVFGSVASGADIVTVNFDNNKTLFYLNTADAVQADVTRSSGLNSEYRTSSVNVGMYFEGLTNGTGSAASSTPSSYDWFGLAGNAFGTPGGFSNNKLACIVAHSGDVDMPALHSTINGVIARLNGGYTMTPLNLNISGMNPMDSGFLTSLSSTLMVYCGGYDPMQPSSASAKVYTTTDCVNFSTVAAMPFDLAHCLGGVRGDGFLWIYTNTQSGNPACIKMDVSTYSWTVVNANLSGAGQSLEGVSMSQVGYMCNDTMYWLGTTDGGVNMRVYRSVNGNAWTNLSAFPAGFATNSAHFVDGSTVTVAGGCLVTGSITSDFVGGVYKSSDGSRTWTQTLTIPDELKSAWPTYFEIGSDRFFVSGRNTAYEIYEGGIYRWTGSEWKNTLLSLLSGRHAVSSNKVGGDVFLMNGYLFNDSYKLGVR